MRIAIGLAPGSVVGGFRIERMLGHGGMGAVYLAEQLRLGRKVALKVVAPQVIEDGSFRERFVREAHLLASVEHPNIVPIYDADEEEGLLYLAMRYVDGGDLRTLLAHEHVLSPEAALRIIDAVAAGLDAAHARGLVHRDVKPANILLEQASGRVYVSDFGLAKSVSATVLTRTGTFVGTVAYCAPEQIDPRVGPVDARTDVYALGCVLYECLTGETPFPRDSEFAVAHAQVADPVPAVTTRRPELPGTLDGVVATAMAKYASVRYSSCSSLANALRAALDSTAGNAPVGAPTRTAVELPPPVKPPATVAEPAPPPPLSSPVTLTLPGRRRRWLLAVAAATLALGLVGAALLLVNRDRLDARADRSGPSVSSTNAVRVSQPFTQAVGDALTPIVPFQRAVTERVKTLQLESRSLAGLGELAEELDSAVIRAQGSANVLETSNARERTIAGEVVTALNAHERYVGAVGRLAQSGRPTERQLQAVVDESGRAETAYAVVSSDLTSLPEMPLAKADHRHLLSLQPPSVPKRTLSLVSVFKGLFPDDPAGSGRCFGPYKSGAYLQIAGVRYQRDFVACGDYGAADPWRANGELTFGTIPLASGARLLRFVAIAGVDEASASSQRGSRVIWTVAYAGNDVCSARTRWSGRASVPVQLNCELPRRAGGTAALVVHQRVELAGYGGFWAGLAKPRVVAGNE